MLPKILMERLPTLLIVPLVAFVTAALFHDANAEANRLTPEERKAGWRLLFDGESTQGWRSYGKDSFPKSGWTVDEGTLHKQADQRPGDIMTRDTFEDFEFSWEWRLLPRGNNGVKYMIIPERKATVGHEYQMIDDQVVKNPYSSCASFYLIVPPRKDKPLKPMGEWNHSLIRVRGNHVEHWLNGMKVVEYECGSEAIMAQVPKTKFKKWPGFGKKVRGHILLTDHKDPCWYRNLKIREFPEND